MSEDMVVWVDGGQKCRGVMDGGKSREGFVEIDLPWDR